MSSEIFPWTPWATYRQGDIATYQRRTYRCRVEHVAEVEPSFDSPEDWQTESMHAWSPVGCPEYWQELGARPAPVTIRAALFAGACCPTSCPPDIRTSAVARKVPA